MLQQQQKQQQKHYLHNISQNKHCSKHFLKQTHLIIKTLFVSQLNNINNNKINKPIISSLLLFSLITDRLFLLFYIIFAFSITNTLSGISLKNIKKNKKFSRRNFPWSPHSFFPPPQRARTRHGWCWCFFQKWWRISSTFASSSSSNTEA